MNSPQIIFLACILFVVVNNTSGPNSNFPQLFHSSNMWEMKRDSQKREKERENAAASSSSFLVPVTAYFDIQKNHTIYPHLEFLIAPQAFDSAVGPAFVSSMI